MAMIADNNETTGARKPMYAALNDMQSKDLPPMMAEFKCKLVVNAQGRLCLVHDRDLKAIPLWVKFKVKLKQLAIVFDNGMIRDLDFNIDDRTTNYLLRANRVFVCKVTESNEVEGYDTVLLNEAY